MSTSIRHCETCDVEIQKCRRFCEYCAKSRIMINRADRMAAQKLTPNPTRKCACGCGRKFVPNSLSHRIAPDCSRSRAGINTKGLRAQQQLAEQPKKPKSKPKGISEKELEHRMNAIVEAARRPDYDARYPERYL